MSTWNIRHLIGDWEEPESIIGSSNDLPIRPEPLINWKLLENPIRYSRVFKFSDETKFNSFIMDLLELQTETQHHARLTIQYPQVKIELWTHMLNDVTVIDKEWCAKANDIYGDYYHDS